MKKILVAGRPYSNGGDFLIYDRIVRVLKKAYPEASVELNLDNDAQFQIEKLNEYDAIVTGGGVRAAAGTSGCHRGAFGHYAARNRRI